jgi:23S rRNA pseudouridine2457 synthase
MIYLAFYKPFKVMSQFKPMEGKETLADYLKLKEKPKAVGRLDFDSEGLLLLSDDENFIYKATSPKDNIEKEYLVQVEGVPTLEKLSPITKGIHANGEFYKPSKVEIISEPELPPRNPPIRFRKNIPTTWLKLIITEGKNRQVRHMTAFTGFPALRLLRIRIGNVCLGDLQPGEYKNIKREDVFR